MLSARLHEWASSNMIRTRAVTARGSMHRRLARKNIRSGLIAGAACIVMFGITFLAAAIYVHP